jgi:hypothetical protein
VQIAFTAGFDDLRNDISAARLFLAFGKAQIDYTGRAVIKRDCDPIIHGSYQAFINGKLYDRYNYEPLNDRKSFKDQLVGYLVDRALEAQESNRLQTFDVNVFFKSSISRAF